MLHFSHFFVISLRIDALLDYWPHSNHHPVRFLDGLIWDEKVEHGCCSRSVIGRIVFIPALPSVISSQSTLNIHVWLLLHCFHLSDLFFHIPVVIQVSIIFACFFNVLQFFQRHSCYPPTSTFNGILHATEITRMQQRQLPFTHLHTHFLLCTLSLESHPDNPFIQWIISSLGRSTRSFFAKCHFVSCHVNWNGKCKFQNSNDEMNLDHSQSVQRSQYPIIRESLWVIPQERRCITQELDTTTHGCDLGFIA